jgi:alkyl hydroperoxide reductase subunit F
MMQVAFRPPVQGSLHDDVLREGRTMLDTNMKTQLKAYLEKLTKPVELIATLDDSAKSAEIKNCWLRSLNCHQSDLQRR